MPSTNNVLCRAWLITPYAPSEIALSCSSIQETDIIIAVDGGLEICKELNLIPKLLIGDMDSLPSATVENLPPGCEKITYQVEKDETDTQLAVEYCLEHNIREIFICNDLSGRFDHTLALIQNLQQAHRNGIKATLVSQTQIITILSSDVTLSHPVNSLLSLISITEKTEFSSSTGLRYPLDNLTLYNWQSRGISNVVTEPVQTLNIVSGQVLSISTQ